MWVTRWCMSTDVRGEGSPIWQRWQWSRGHHGSKVGAGGGDTREYGDPAVLL
jgi:hypothetical protein